VADAGKGESWKKKCIMFAAVYSKSTGMFVINFVIHAFLEILFFCGGIFLISNRYYV
jgi:hypothetical protein